MIIGSMLDFFRWISRLPLRLLHAFGAALGWLTWALSPSYRRRFAANAQCAGLDSQRVGPAVAEAGRMVGLLPDQVPPDGMGVWAPLFGEPAYTMTLAARLVQMSGARRLLAACERLPRGSGYVMTISEPPQPLPPAQSDQVAHQTE